MNTKDKLELLWKYLALAVVVFGIASFSGRSEHHKFSFSGGKEPMVIKSLGGAEGEEMRVEVEKKIVDGDTTTVVKINGEEVDPSELDDLEHGVVWLEEEDLAGGGEEKIVIKVIGDDDDDQHGKKVKKIRKRIKKEYE